MVIPRVTSCCCGCSLRTACIIFGFFSIFGGLGYLLRGGNLVGHEGYQLMGVSSILVSIFAIGITICFLIGIDKEKPQLITPYLALQVVGIIFYLIFVLCTLNLILILFALFACVIQSYFVIVIYSFRAELEEKAEQNRAAHNNPI